MAAAVIPKMFVFDLDNCVWNPEMYQLWGSGGPPFVRNADNTCSSHGGSGEKVRCSYGGNYVLCIDFHQVPW